MQWITLEENDNYEINVQGEIRYKPKGSLIKVDGNHCAVYRNDKKKTLNVKKLLAKYFDATIENLEGEIWREVVHYEGLYQVSNLGRVKALSRQTNNSVVTFNTVEKIMNGTIANGYLIVTMRKDGKQLPRKIHRVVAFAFLPNPEKKREVNHIDGNRVNNKVDNLEWCTPKENIRHAYKTGLNKGPYSKQKKLGVFKSRAKRKPPTI